uniref:DZF domain-containing protein n=1 Tax=Hippocampus comes TaxID=109280 RepID=A0A3Q2YB79_HIPCM
LELLAEKAISTSERPLGPGEAFRRVLECLASGILLADGPGIKDPCEKEPIDVLGSLTLQQREDTTQSAQLALRLCAFGMMYKVLGIEAKPGRPWKVQGASAKIFQGILLCFKSIHNFVFNFICLLIVLFSSSWRPVWTLSFG